MIGDQVSLGIEDDARTEAAFHALANLRRISSQQGIADSARRAGHDARRIDVHDRRAGAAHRVSK
jgi:hypothetical protein